MFMHVHAQHPLNSFPSNESENTAEKNLQCQKTFMLDNTQNTKCQFEVFKQ